MVIEPTGHSHGQIISDIFLRDKKDDSNRMILNLKKLNQYASKIHFKMDTLNTVIKLIEKDCYMASIDLEDAYYSVSITPADRKYLRFMWRGSLFQFTCLLNGLSCAPRKFTKLLKPALSTLHLRSHVSSAYLDDMYLQGKTYRGCVDDVIDSVQVVDSLGFVAHPDKSTFIPPQRLEFLGFILNSVEMTIRLTQEKATGLQTACNILLTNPSPTIWDLARVIGKIVSSFPAARYGPLYYQSLEHYKLTALHVNRWNFVKSHFRPRLSRNLNGGRIMSSILIMSYHGKAQITRSLQTPLWKAGEQCSELAPLVAYGPHTRLEITSTIFNFWRLFLNYRLFSLS